MSLSFSLGELAQAVNGSLHGASPATAFRGISTDSRKATCDTAFFALRGDRFDGHAYLPAVAEAGAAVAVVAADFRPPSMPLPTIVVPDTRRALGDLAAYWRRRFSMPLVGVTGSNGKTTTKEMLAAIFRAKARRLGQGETATLATRGNLNNDIGVPLMLAELNADTRCAVIEMGMNHPGEIAYLAGIAAPTVALVTNAQRAHLEGMGSLAEVAQEKASIFWALPEDGVAVINGDDANAGVFLAAAGKRRKVVASLDAMGDVVGRYQAGRPLQIDAPEGSLVFDLPLLGRHNARNAVIAAAAALAAGATLDDIAAGLSAMTKVAGRLALRRGQQGARIVDDSYNANPDSMRAAIEVLAEFPGRRILAVGDMGEVGSQGAAMHREVAAYAKEFKLDGFFATGEAMLDACAAYGPGARHYPTPEAMAAAILPLLAADTTVLVKGSRFMRMERAVEALLDPNQNGDS